MVAWRYVEMYASTKESEINWAEPVRIHLGFAGISAEYLFPSCARSCKKNGPRLNGRLNAYISFGLRATLPWLMVTNIHPLSTLAKEKLTTGFKTTLNGLRRSWSASLKWVSKLESHRFFVHAHRFAFANNS